jgi:hypothetical protein
MRKLALRFLGLTLVATALGSSLPQPAQAQVCNLLCIQGYHCQIIHGQPTCVPDEP